MMNYKNSSCSRDILKGYRPVSTSKSAPKLANGQAPGQFQAPRGFKLLQDPDFSRFLTCLSACSPLEYRGSSCEINSVYFLEKRLRQSPNLESVGPTAFIQVPMGKLTKPASAASHLSRWQPAHSESQRCKKRSCSRSDLKGCSPNMYLTIALKAAETNAIALQRPERLGIDLMEDCSGTLAGKTGGAYNDAYLAYVGGGYEYRKYSMGTMTLLVIDAQGDGKNEVRGYYRTRSCSRDILKGNRAKRHVKTTLKVTEPAAISPCTACQHACSGPYKAQLASQAKGTQNVPPMPLPNL
jgi:hypothetical protein